MYSDGDGELAVRIARATIEEHVQGKPLSSHTVPSHFQKKAGVFVTINRYPSHELRGCIGFPEPFFPLTKALIKSAMSAATEDPRFPSLRPEELDKIVVEVSLLTPPALIEVEKPRDYPRMVKVGEDGLIAAKGARRGLLLPQVPVEYKWDASTFLEHTCMKAGLYPDAWLDGETRIYKFQGEVFVEVKPRGKVVRKELSSCD